MNWKNAVITFILGIIISLVGGSLLEDGGFAAATAVCYVGAILVGLFYRK